MSSFASRRLPQLVLLAAGLTSAALLWSHRDYVPLFDGRIYADCITAVADHPGNLADYRCAGHVSESVVAILSVAAHLANGSFAAMLAANAMLLLLGAVALWRLSRRVFPGEEHALGRALVVGAFLVHPVVLAAVVQPGLDLGLLVFSLCALTAVMEHRRGLVVLFGILLVFAKEPGILLYGVIVAVWSWRECRELFAPDERYRIGIAAFALLAALALLNHQVPSALFFLVAALVVARKPREPSRPLGMGVFVPLRRDWPLAIPVLLLVAYMAWHTLAPESLDASAAAKGQPVLWGGGGGTTKLLATLLRGGMFDPATLSMLALTFVVGFLWLPTLWTLVDAAIGAVRYARLRGPRPLPGVEVRTLNLVLIVLLAEVWLLSRFVTFSNARYYLPIFPLALLAAYAALVRLGVRPVAREALLALSGVLLAVSVERTIDPVSRRIWGTFPVGDRALLSITSLRNECCGHGRDQLAYNLEFTRFASLQDLLYERLEPTDSTVLVVPPEGNWFTVEALDSVTHHRTMRQEGAVRPRVVNAPDAYDLKAERAWYVELPFIKDTVFRSLIRRRYDVGEPCRVTRDGYALAVREMRLRSAIAASPSMVVHATSDAPGASPCTPPGSALSIH